MGVQGVLADTQDCKSSGQSSAPGRNRVKDKFRVLPSEHLRRLVSACFTTMCTAQAKIVTHI